MAKTEEESMSDGLEIVSIGALYTGPWDKKYWSCSRGKDRYPYPVGYHAVRSHKGVTYKMEIHEGSKGPLFQITSNYRQSACGQTPDIAWDNFQKKGSRIKLWHGKRFSSKIDGVEFFGFKNALVQRLLREMVASVNGASEQSPPLTNFKGVSVDELDPPCSRLCTYPDLIPYLEKPRVTGKRSRKHKSTDMKSENVDTPLSCHLQHQASEVKILNSSQRMRTGDNGSSISSPAMNDKCDADNDSGAFPGSANTEHQQNIYPTANGLPSDFGPVSFDLKVEPCLAKDRELTSSEAYMLDPLANANLPQDERHLDRSQCLEAERLNFSTANEDRHGEELVSNDLLSFRPPVPEDSQANNPEDFCAPDTVEPLQENDFPNSPNQSEGVTKVKPDADSSHMVLSEEPDSGSHAEEGTWNCSLNGSSEKSDFDSVGEDITKSMMTFLLPQAVPLLTYSSRRKKRKAKHVKDSFSEVKRGNQFGGTGPPADTSSSAGELAANSQLEGQKETHIPDIHLDSVFSFENIKSVVPDSYENDQFEANLVNQVVLSSDVNGTVETSFEKDNRTDGKESPFLSDETKDLSSSHHEITGWKETVRCKELHPAVGCTSSIQEMCVAGSKHKLSASDNDSGSLEIQSSKRQFDAAFDSTDGKINYSLNKLLSSIPVSIKEERTSNNDRLNQDPSGAPLMEKYDGPLSESIICRNSSDDCGPKTFHPGSHQGSSFTDKECSKASVAVAGELTGQLCHLHKEKTHEAVTHCSTFLLLQDQALGSALNKVTAESISNTAFNVDAVYQNNAASEVSHSSKHGTGSQNSYESCAKQVQVDCHARPNLNLVVNHDLEGIIKLIGCYLHPTKISSVMLTRTASEIYICVSCGVLEEKERNLFIYRIETLDPSLGCPSLVGHTSLKLPLLKDDFGRDIASDKCGLYFTPDASGLVLLDAIKTPYCRECRYDCACASCASCCFEENAVKIVQFKEGYVSLVVKLKAAHSVRRVLVCGSEHLIALDESGRLYVWVMNPTWSAHKEKHIIPSYDLLASRIVELKRIPRAATLVVGHNGYGEFSLWDIMKLTVLSTFSATVNSVLEFLPVSLFNWKKGGPIHDKMEECVEGLMAATMMGFSKNDDKSFVCPLGGEDICVWVLICTSSGLQPQSGCQLSSYIMNSGGCWRLGLLVKNTVILGDALDPRTSAIGTSAGHGIIGTHEGLVYIWALPTGDKVGTLNNFKGAGVSHIAIDDTTATAIAIAGDGGELRVYRHS